ncbi:MAG: hypothetical protein IPO81_09670 [Kouleothrix sp.]|nr:hypothetical protein [Kouleothrix sp.]
MRGCVLSLLIALLAVLLLIGRWAEALVFVAVPIAFLIGHWAGWRGAVAVMEAAGHTKVEHEAEELRKGWRWWGS